MFTGVFLWLHPDNLFLIHLLDFALREDLLLFGCGLVCHLSLVVDLLGESATVEIPMALASPFSLLSLSFLGLVAALFVEALGVVIRARPGADIWHGIFDLIEFSRTDLAVCIERWFRDNESTWRLIIGGNVLLDVQIYVLVLGYRRLLV